LTAHLEGLLPYANGREAEYIRACIEHGTQQAAATELGVYKRTVERALQRVRKTAQRKGYDPDNDLTRPASGERIAKRISTNYDESGAVRQQWVITEPEKQAQIDAMQEAVNALKEEVPRAEPTTAPYIEQDNKLLNELVLSDLHMNMLAWHEETGADWDVEIAQDVIIKTVEKMLARAPKAHSACIVDLGDFLHSDGVTPMTYESGHILDADTRFYKAVRMSVDIKRYIVKRALETHQHVYIYEPGGNHDEHHSIHNLVWQEVYYENEPRVTVKASPSLYNVHQHGNVMLAYHHGHKTKMENMPSYFAACYPETWGATKYRFGNSGHKHHLHEKNLPGMFVRQHPTLAPQDAYAARAGYIAEREAIMTSYHADYGRDSSVHIGPQMLD